MSTDIRTFALAGLFALVLAACTSQDEAGALAAADKRARAGDGAGAIVELKQWLAETPESTAARLRLGRLLLAAGKVEDAESELKRALDGTAEHDAVLPVLAQALLLQRKTTELFALGAGPPLANVQAEADLFTIVAKGRQTLGDLPGAQVAVERALRRVPEHPAALAMNVRLHAETTGVPEALTQATALQQRFPRDAEVQLLRADALAAANDAAAPAAYEQALRLDPRLEAAHGALIGVAIQARDYTQAKKRVADMRAALPGQAMPIYYQAVVAYAQGDWPAAREATQLLLRGKEPPPLVLMLAGLTERRLGALTQAEALLSKALVAMPQHAELRRETAAAQAQLGKPELALQTLKPTLDLATKDRSASARATWLTAGRVYTQLGDYKAADAAFARAKAHSRDAAVLLESGRSLLARGNEEAGLRDLQAAAESAENADALLELIPAHVRRRDFDAALATVDKLSKVPGAPPAQADFLRGRILEDKRDTPAARAAYQAALKQQPGYLPALDRLAAMDLAEQQPEAARKRYQGLLKIDPKSAAALLGLAELARMEGAPPADVQGWLDKLADVQPQDAAAWRAALQLERQLGSASAWLARAQRAAAALPDDPDMHVAVAQAQRANGSPNQAQAALGKAITLRPKAPELRLMLADVLLAANDLAGARRAVDEALRLAPAAFEVERAHAMLLVHEEKAEQAVTLAEARRKRLPRDVDTLLLLADTQALAGRQAPSMATLRKALGISEAGFVANRISDDLRRTGDGEQAKAFEQDWLRKNPTDLVFIGYQAQQAAQRGEDAAAEGLYRQALVLQPSAALALNNLATLLLKSKPQEALKLAERATQLAPSSPALLDTLAQARAATGQLDGAIRAQKRAVDLDPQADALRLSLGKFYLRAKEGDKARQTLRPLVDRDGAQGPQAEARKLLAELDR